MTPPDSTLLADLAAAPCGSRGLDEWIERLLYPELRLARDAEDRWRTEDGAGTFVALEEYTTSLDAALMLVPDHLWYLMGKGRTRQDEPLYGVQLAQPDADRLGSKVVQTAEAHTLPLALCIAALRARGVA